MTYYERTWLYGIIKDIFMILLCCFIIFILFKAENEKKELENMLNEVPTNEIIMTN